MILKNLHIMWVYALVTVLMLLIGLSEEDIAILIMLQAFQLHVFHTVIRCKE
jgi:hypothetical protein